MHLNFGCTSILCCQLKIKVSFFKYSVSQNNQDPFKIINIYIYVWGDIDSNVARKKSEGMEYLFSSNRTSERSCTHFIAIVSYLNLAHPSNNCIHYLAIACGADKKELTIATMRKCDIVHRCTADLRRQIEFEWRKIICYVFMHFLFFFSFSF